MAKLNKYVFENKDSLVNLTTKKVLPKNSSHEALHENFFLDGQEKESLDYALFGSTPASLEITLVPTWECNLRCTHCFVLHELLKKDDNELDEDRLVSFIERYKQAHPEVVRIGFYFLGGEPALRAKKNISIINSVRSFGERAGVKTEFSATSNGVEMSPEILEFYSMLKSLSISIDGNKESHDKQRKSPEHKSPFEQTLKTIKTLVKFGMRDKIRVQASIDEKHFNEDLALEFHKTMLMAGVMLDHMHFGLNVPTGQNPDPGAKFIEISRSKVYSRACCKYRFMNNLIVDSRNNVYCDYFHTRAENLLGSLDDPISKIEEGHRKIISSKMQVLNDDKCMECSVIGACWGWCCNLVGLVKPSEHCNQAGLISKIKSSAESGGLIELLNLNSGVCENK